MFKKVKIGIDLGATRIKIALVDERGRILSRRETDTPFNFRKEVLIDAIVKNVQGIIEKAGIKKGIVAGVGIGVPGPVDSKQGIVHYFPNIRGWENVPLKAILQKKLGLRVAMDNDVNAMTIGEYAFGAGRGASNLICITLGTGVGGGIIIDGKLYRGGAMVAGEIGHVPINERGPRCNCGGIACLERYIGNRYILDKAKKVFGKGITLEKLSRLGQNGDKRARKIWKDVGRKLGTALTGVVNLFNPDRIVIGGGVSKAGGLILRPLRREIKSRAMRNQASHVKIVRTKMGGDAGVIGASLLI